MLFKYLVLNTDLLAMVGIYIQQYACAVDSQHHGYLKQND